MCTVREVSEGALWCTARCDSAFGSARVLREVGYIPMTCCRVQQQSCRISAMSIQLAEGELNVVFEYEGRPRPP